MIVWDAQHVQRSLLVVVVGALAMIASACGSSGDVATSAAAQSADTDTTGAAASNGDADGGADDSSNDNAGGAVDDGQTRAEARLERYSPISEALGQVLLDEDEVAEQERDAQVLIRECMLALGFEYDIVDTSERIQFRGGGNQDMTELEFVETFGYGYSTQFEERFETIGARIAGPNANNERTAAMGEAEAQAYQEALQGASPFEGVEIDPETRQPIDPETGELVNRREFLRNFEPSGCQADAYEEVFGAARQRGGRQGGRNNGIDDDLRTGIQDLQEEIAADARIVAANDEWSVCMTEAGYSFATQDDVEQEIESRVRPIEQALFGTPQERAAQRQALQDADLASMSEEERIAFLEEVASPELDAENQLLLDDVQKFELAVAKADFECSANIDSAYEEVRIEYEEKFVSENQAAFDAAKASLGN